VAPPGVPQSGSTPQNSQASSGTEPIGLVPGTSPPSLDHTDFKFSKPQPAARYGRACSRPRCGRGSRGRGSMWMVIRSSSMTVGGTRGSLGPLPGTLCSPHTPFFHSPWPGISSLNLYHGSALAAAWHLARRALEGVSFVTGAASVSRRAIGDQSMKSAGTASGSPGGLASYFAVVAYSGRIPGGYERQGAGNPGPDGRQEDKGDTNSSGASAHGVRIPQSVEAARLRKEEERLRPRG